MLGAIIGDIVGSAYEFTVKKPEMNFDLMSKYSKFTDDTVLTCVVADSLLNGKAYAQ